VKPAPAETSAAAATSGAPAIRVRDLTKSFAGRTVIRGVSFDVPRHEMVGLIGPNGAGKTTIIQMMSGAHRVDSGSVLLDGKDITRARPDRINRLGLARTFQQPRPFTRMTAAENVMVAALSRRRYVGSARDVAQECLDFVGLTKQADTPAAAMSTGQRKRLELARAMATKPSVFLLDEVTAGVDERTTDELVALIGRLRESGATIVFVEHDLSLLRRLCGRLIALDLGVIIADGTPTEVLSDARVIESYVGTE
jgi:branched-chain amino acid transport system ATP-binding protein